MASSDGSQTNQKTPLDVAVDVLVFAPIGIALELGKQIPEFARQGRAHLEGPLNTAKFVGNFAAMQGRKEFGEKFRKATEPFFGGPADEPVASTATEKPRRRADLPIAGYDTLSATQILDHLTGLGIDELRQIEEYELANRGRKTVLNRIVQLITN